MVSLVNVLTVARTALSRDGVADPENSPEYRLYAEIVTRKAQTDGDAGVRAALYRRFDDLYYPAAVTKGGADHWSDDPNLAVDGKVHISLNNAPTYVDLPANLQALQPYINAVPDGPSKDDQKAADRRETLFWAFWDACHMDLLFPHLSLIRSLYGAVPVKPYWDAVAKEPRVSIIESPENLRIGWGSNDFSRKDWALYSYTLSPQAVREDYGLTVTPEDVGGEKLMLVRGGTHADPLGLTTLTTSRNPTEYEKAQVAVLDYWYKVPKVKGFTVWNAIYVGNHQVVNAAHREYDDIPYVYIPNGKVPGRPDGPSELYGPEQVLREIDERVSNYGQLIYKVLAKPQHQILGGDDYPTEFSASMMPGADRPGMPGPGNRIEPVQAFIPAFQWGEYMKYLDQKLVEMTGMSDLLMGLAGSRVAGSSKAINAELAMYVPRIALKRECLYVGLHELWAVVGKMWSRKDPDVAKILDDNYRLDIRAPEITVRDDVEQAQRATMLVKAGLWARRRGQDATGVDNPSDEDEAIRRDNTDAALEPERVMTEIQLIGMAKAAGFASPGQAAAQGPEQVSMRDKALTAMSQKRIGGSNAANQPGVAGSPEQMGPNALGPGGTPSAAPGLAMTSQSMLQAGETTGRVLSEQKIVGGQ